MALLAVMTAEHQSSEPKPREEPVTIPLTYDGQEPASPRLPSGPGRLVVGQISKPRFVLAFAIAAVSDVLSFGLTFTGPIQWLVDVTTAFLLFVILGWRWLLLPGLVMEAIPGLSAFPVWTLVVSALAAPALNRAPRPSKPLKPSADRNRQETEG